MNRILLALSAVTLSLALAQAADDKKPAGKADTPAADKVPKDTCVQECMHCAKECEACMLYCRGHKMDDTAKQCEICHHACLMCAIAVGGKNVRAWEICEQCEKICNDCAAACDKGTAPEMKKCADECRKCAKACADARK